MVGHRLSSAWGRFRTVTIDTSHGNVSTSQAEPRLFMAGERERRWGEALDGVAAFAAVAVRSPCELCLMDVRVAVRAECVLDFVASLRPGRWMALGARDISVFPFEGIRRGGVLGNAEFCGFEPVHSVARLTGTAIFACAKLSTVGIRLVAIRALLICHRYIERLSVMAGAAFDIGVFAGQREFGLGVIEPFTQYGRGDLLPCDGCVAGFAIRLESSPMWINVARRALLKGQAREFECSRLAGFRFVALRTGDLDVRAGQRKLGLGMIEPGGLLPAVECVALETVLP